MAGSGAAPGSTGGGASSESALVAIVVILALVVNGALGAYIFYSKNSAQASYNVAKAEHDRVKTELEATAVEYEEMQLTIERMTRLISVAESLDPVDRVLWSRKLNQLPLLIPEGVYLTGISVNQDVKRVETPESIQKRNTWTRSKQKNKGPEPEKEFESRITWTMRLDGVAYRDGATAEQRLEQIVRFYRNLENNTVRLPFDKEESSYMEGIAGKIEVSSVTGGTMQGREVSNFNFTMKTDPLTIR